MKTPKNFQRFLIHSSFLLPVFLLLLLAATVTQAASPQAQRALINNPLLEYGPDSVLVKFSPAAAPSQKLHAHALVNGEKMRGYSLVRGLEHIKLGKGHDVKGAVRILQQLPYVEYAEPDYVLRAETNDTYYGYQWGLNNTGQDIRGTAGVYDADIDAAEAWTVTTGDPNFIVASIDTGVDYTHEDLVNNIWVNPGEIAGDSIDNDGNGYIDDVHGWDFFANDADPMDENGHGTHTSGTVCAEGNNGIGVSGVVWHCKIMALRFLDANGSGYTSDALAALNYAVDMGVKVSNNSWGGGGFSQAMYDAIQNAGNSGDLFVAAAGNGGQDGIGDNDDVTPFYPASYDLGNIISVAATDNQDQLAGFSNYGIASVDLGAPGVDIASTMLSGYYWSSGTSMATPHVTGVVALVYGLHPEWTYQQVRDRIYNTVRPIAALNGKTATGGMVNAYAAVLEPTSAPAAPTGLSAVAFSDTQIELSWSDNSTNEDGFKIERSPDGSGWQEIAATDKDISQYIDSSLDPETTYYYRVRAFNSVGDSDYSNTADATTDATPTAQEVTAGGEILGAGVVNGTYDNTWYDDGTVESITERKSGGRPSLRYSYLEHTWTFTVPPGSATFYLNAWSNQSTDNDSFRFAYSVDNTNFTDMVSVAGGDDATGWYSYILPPGISGTVYVRVTDTDRNAGNLNLDTVSVDLMYFLVEQAAGNPPAAPSGLTAAAVAGQIDLNWTDNSTDEYGFEVERSADGGTNWNILATVAADVQAYSDTDVSPETTYDYRARAFNGAGYSGYSNMASATTPASSGITLSGSGYKIKGVQYVDLGWDNPAIAVDIYRDSTIIDTVAGGVFTDGPLAKGGGVSYTYQVCESGGTANCSNEVIVVF